MKKPVYSLLQMAILSFFGWSIASTYGLKKNFDAVENKKASIITIIAGVISAFVFSFIWMTWSEELPSMSMPIFFAVIACLIAFFLQLKDIDKDEHSSYSFFNVIMVILISWLLTFICFFLTSFTINAIEIYAGAKQ